MQQQLDATIADQRAWVTYSSVNPSTGFSYQPDGGANIAFDFYLKNTGRSPAFNVFIWPKLTFMAYGIDPAAEQRVYCDHLAAEYPRVGGYTLFPGETPPKMILGGSASKTEIEKAKIAGRFIQPYLVGCITYRTTGSNKIHQTGFIFQISRIATERPQPGSLVALEPTLGDTPVNSIGLSVEFIYGVRVD